MSMRILEEVPSNMPNASPGGLRSLCQTAYAAHPPPNNKKTVL